MTHDSKSHVTILMCTRNGARFLPSQLNSFLAQSHEDWSLWVSDDGSDDATLKILREFRAAHPSRIVRLFRGPRQGIGANYLSLICRSDIPKGIVALSDQDDVWLPAKLKRGVQMLARHGHGRPTLYASGYRPVDPNLMPIKITQRPVGPLGFRAALQRNRLCGATMMLPPQTVDLARRAGPRAVPFHDWWLNLLVTGVGGDILYDTHPTLLYRQHENNALGLNHGFRAFGQRVGMVLRGEHRSWHQINQRALEEIWYELDSPCFQHLKQVMRGAQGFASNPRRTQHKTPLADQVSSLTTVS
ncbi:glycosyltransferase [Actibacterium pelagium]|nr:glycosyltransferase [Actibacterium pelagium]